MKRKLLISPFLIAVMIIIFGIAAVSASIFIGGGGNSENVNLSKGLVGWWKFDGDAKDSTPYGNNGTVTGATLVSDRKSQALKAYDFDGTDYINAGNGSSLEVTTAFSMGAWIKPSTVAPSYQLIIGKSGKWTRSLFLSNGQLRSYAGHATTGANSDSVGGTISAGSWQHVFLVFRNSTFYLYKNGIEVSYSVQTVGVGAQTSYSANALYISDATDLFNGVIDDVRLYNRALSATEITALYQEYNPGIQVSDLQKGLVGQWKMDGNAKDATPQGNNGTVTGAVLVSDRKSQALKAYSFDGTDDKIVASTVASSPFRQSSAITYSFWTSIPTGGTARLGTAVSGGHGSGGVAAQLTGINFSWTPTTPNADRVWSATVSLSADTWYHVVVTMNFSGASSGKIYVNGVDQSATISTADVTNGTPRTSYNTANGDAIGARYINSWQYGQATIDDVRIYNRALSAAEITALYQEYNPGIQVSDLQKGLIGHWKMDGNTKDSTPYGNNRLFGSGGTITFSGEYVIHTFTSSGTFTANGSGNVEVLVVGGGGGGGTTGGRGGGGGGGGYQYNSSFAVTQQAYTVTVGAGGAKGVYDSSCSQNGQDSAFGSTVTATGGGRGGGTSNIACSVNGGNGGSGGGGEGNTFSAGGTGSQGSNGGAGSTTDYNAGGGGGAGGAGANGTSNGGGAGGTGTSNSISGASVCYAGGGGGGFTGSGGSATCGGGAGASGIATAGTANTGGGGGGANTGADGGSGIVIIRYINSNMSTTVNETFTTDRKGQVNKAYNFDGSTTEINAGDSASGSLETSSAMSISAWIKTNTISADKSIVSKYDGTNGFRFYYYYTNYLNLFVGAQNGQITVNLEDNVWHHVVGTWDGTNTRIYVDGVLPAGGTDAPGTTLAANTGSFRIGFLDNGAANEHWQGDIDEVRYYNRVLSQTEITALYQQY